MYKDSLLDVGKRTSTFILEDGKIMLVAGWQKNNGCGKNQDGGRRKEKG